MTGVGGALELFNCGRNDVLDTPCHLLFALVSVTSQAPCINRIGQGFAQCQDNMTKWDMVLAAWPSRDYTYKSQVDCALSQVGTSDM